MAFAILHIVLGRNPWARPGCKTGRDSCESSAVRRLPSKWRVRNSRTELLGKSPNFQAESEVRRVATCNRVAHSSFMFSAGRLAMPPKDVNRQDASPFFVGPRRRIQHDKARQKKENTNEEINDGHHCGARSLRCCNAGKCL